MPKSHWDMFFSDLERNKPEWFIDHSGVDMQQAPLKKFPELAGYISSNYRLVDEIEGNSVYRRLRRDDESEQILKR